MANCLDDEEFKVQEIQREEEPKATDPKKDELFILRDVFYLILKLLRDPAMPYNNKLKLGIALIYFLSPLDFIPAFILGPLGLTDDIVVSAFVMNILFNQTDYQLILRNWPGKEANLIVARRLIQSAGQWLGKGFLGKLRAVFSITRK